MVDPARLGRPVARLAIVPQDKAVMLLVEAHECRDIIAKADLGVERISVPCGRAVEVLRAKAEMG